MKEEVAAVGLGLYGSVIVLVLGVLAWLYSALFCSSCTAVRRSPPLSSPKILFYFFIFLFLLCRMAWFAVGAWCPEHYSDYVINRTALALFFTAFTLVIFYWADTLHAMRNPLDHTRPTSLMTSGSPQGFIFRSWKTSVVFVLLNALIYAGEVAFVVIFFIHDHKQREGRHAYDVNIALVAAFVALICLAFVLYGIGLLLVTRRAMNTERKLRFYIQTVVVTSVLVLCFALRFAVYLYRPITDEYLDPWLFMTLAYFVPELVPTALLAVVLCLSFRRQITAHSIPRRYHTLPSRDSDEYALLGTTAATTWRQHHRRSSASSALPHYYYDEISHDIDGSEDSEDYNDYPAPTVVSS